MLTPALNRRIFGLLSLALAAFVATYLWEHRVLWTSYPYGGPDRLGFQEARQEMFDRYWPIIAAFRAVAAIAVWRAFAGKGWAQLALAAPLFPSVVLSAFLAMLMLLPGHALLVLRRWRPAAVIIAFNLLWSVVGYFYLGDFISNYWD